MQAVVLSGGGAKGIYQAYELAQQLKEGLSPPDIVYGSSVGAINACGYAYNGVSLLNLWKGIRGRRDVMARNWRFWSATGIYNSRPLRRLLKTNLLEPARCRAVVCHVDLITRGISYIYNDQVSFSEFLDAVQASAAIPFAMSPLGSRVDGGVREVTPLYRAIQDGADSITVILCNPYTKTQTTDLWEMPRGFFPVLGVGVRAIDIMEHEIFMNDIEHCLYYNQLPGKKKINLRVFSPKAQDMFIKTLDFDPDKISAVIQNNIRMEKAVDSTSLQTLARVA